jgi:hypothetical protein
LRFVAPREGATEVPRDPTSAEAQFASHVGSGRHEILINCSQQCFPNPKFWKCGGPHTQGPKRSIKVCSPARLGGRTQYLVTQKVPTTPFASYFGFGRRGILAFFLTAVFFQPKVLKKVAGRTRKDRNVELRLRICSTQPRLANRCFQESLCERQGPDPYNHFGPTDALLEP